MHLTAARHTLALFVLLACCLGILGTAPAAKAQASSKADASEDPPRTSRVYSGVWIGPGMVVGSHNGDDWLYNAAALVDLRVGATIGSRGMRLFGSARAQVSEVGSGSIGPGLELRVGSLVMSFAVHLGGGKGLPEDGVRDKGYGLVGLDGEIGFVRKTRDDRSWRLVGVAGGSINFPYDRDVHRETSIYFGPAFGMAFGPGA